MLTEAFLSLTLCQLDNRVADSVFLAEIPGEKRFRNGKLWQRASNPLVGAQEEKEGALGARKELM